MNYFLRGMVGQGNLLTKRPLTSAKTPPEVSGEAIEEVTQEAS